MLIRLINLVLTLHVSIAITERVFSMIKYVKTALRNKMNDNFFANYLTFYIKQDFVINIDVDSIIDEFYVLKPRLTKL